MKKILAFCLIIVAQTVAAKKFTTEKWQTTNGTKVIFYQAMEVPMLDISLAFAAGSAYDGAFHGLGALTNQLINQGGVHSDANAIAENLADTGAQFEANSSREMAVLHLKTLVSPAVLSKAVTLFSEIVAEPNFPQDAFEREKKQQMMAIKQSQESPDDVASIAFFKALYQDHPYAHPINGTLETVAKLERDQVVQFYKQYYVGNNAILVLVGAITSKEAHGLAEKLTHVLPKGQAAPPIAVAKPVTKALSVHIPYPSSQTPIRLGQLGIDHHTKAYFPLTVGNYILGGGALVSRLALEVRGNRGLTYGVSSQFLPLSGKGPFLISLSTKNNQANAALILIEDLLKTFIEKGPQEEELKAAKQFLTGSFSLSLSSNRNIASTLLKMAFFHLPDDYLDTYVSAIEAVTLEEMKAAFQEQINVNKMLTVTVGKS